jgi:hypothetical protein
MFDRDKINQLKKDMLGRYISKNGLPEDTRVYDKATHSFRRDEKWHYFAGAKRWVRQNVGHYEPILSAAERAEEESYKRPREKNEAAKAEQQWLTDWDGRPIMPGGHFRKH